MAQADADTLKKAFKGIGCDKKTIVDLVVNRTNAQRLQIKEAYKASYGRDLMKDLKSELHNHLEDAVLALFTGPSSSVISFLMIIFQLTPGILQ